MAKKNKLNHHLYQDKESAVWYFQKKVRGISKPYKFSLETTSVVEARRKRDNFLKEIELHGQILKPEVASSKSMLFGEATVKWSEIVQIEETTLDNYRKIMNTHVLPAFGNCHIDTITSLDIEVFISKLKCGGKTKQNILTPFKDVMKFAKKHKIIQTNPFNDIDPIKKTKSKKKRPLSLDEIKLFLNNLNEFWKPLFIFLFFTGARIAEPAGLKWKCVDLVNGVVKIRKTLVYVRGKKIYKRPKTESSTRDIKLPKIVIEALREQRKKTWKGNGDNFVFLNKIGANIHRHTLNNGIVRPTLVKAGIPSNISIKDTRATYITNSLDKNERMSFIQRQVGHTTTRMIVDHYYRYVPAPDDGKRLEDAWNSTSILPDQDDYNLEVVENTI